MYVLWSYNIENQEVCYQDNINQNDVQWGMHVSIL